MSVSGQLDGSKGAPTLNIGLLWHTFFSENLGVGALTIANSTLIANAVIKAGYRPVFHLFGSRGELEYSSECQHENHFINVGYKSVANPFSSLHREMRRCDIVFDIGAGDSFSDIYPWRRFNLILGSKAAVGLAGTPLVFSPQTIGPFFTGRAKAAAKGVMNMADHIFARDEASYGVLEEMGMKDTSSLTTDVAFALPFETPADKESRDLTTGPIKVGLNVSAYLYRHADAPTDNVRLTVDYRDLIENILTKLTNDEKYEVHLVAHVIKQSQPYEDDHSVAEELHQRFPGTVLPPRFRGPSEAKSYVANLDFLAGSRMHATIAAISSNTAVLPLGYSRKFNGLYDSIGYRRNADLTVENNDQVMAKFDAALADIPGLRAEAVAANAEAQRRLGNYRAALDDMIGKLVADRA